MQLTRRQLVTGGMALATGLPMASAAEKTGNKGDRGETVTRPQFILYPVGKVEKQAGRTRLRIDEPYRGGLLGLADFSHVHVFWWFDKNDSPRKRRVLQVYPRGDKGNPLTGVFATRAPVRPNLIATTLCRIQTIRDGLIDVDAIDAFDGTPILDLKPYIPMSDCVADEVRVPDWL